MSLICVDVLLSLDKLLIPKSIGCWCPLPPTEPKEGRDALSP